MADANMSDQAYAEFVRGRFDEAAQKNTLIIFTNRGTSHAKSVLGQLVSRAEQSLDIFTGCLSADVYDVNTIRAAARSLPKPIRILVGDPAPLAGSLLPQLQAEIDNKSVMVRDIKPLREQLADRVFQHFAIGDDKHIRSEQDASDRTALVILNAQLSEDNGKISRQYCEFFEKIWNKSEEWKSSTSA